MGKDSAFKLAPAIFSDLTKFISPSALEVADLTGIGGLISSLSFRLLTSSGVSKVQKSLESEVQDIEIVKKLPYTLEEQLLNDELDDKQKQHVADSLINLYFLQLTNPEGLFLDLRPKNLWFNTNANVLAFRPNSAWLKFKPGFAEGLAQLYTGFYKGDEGLFETGLRVLNLVPKHETELNFQEIKDLFKNHFGKDLTATTFSLATFYESFHQIFEFFKREKITLSADFVVLGMQLTTLYVALEQLDRAINVQKLYLATID
jgi:predicted unusual protein kinase regulating ubiquinone biosynthesis (AarF/ABC1/UbiB family)